MLNVIFEKIVSINYKFSKWQLLISTVKFQEHSKSSRLVKLREFYKDYANSSSLTVFKYTVSERSNTIDKYSTRNFFNYFNIFLLFNFKFLYRLIWMIIILVLIFASGVFIKLFYERFDDGPTQTVFYTQYQPIISIPFPGILLCGTKKFRHFQVEKFITK